MQSKGKKAPKHNQAASLFIGRFQPFHDGHKVLIESVLQHGKPVVIGLRDTAISGDNPYTISERITQISDKLSKYRKQISFVTIPDIDEICYGRKVGYDIRRIDVGGTLELISGTKTRKSRNRVIWLTGNSGSGKTTIAHLLRERLDGVVLDGDEMRASISLNTGFSKEEREEHNLRVARLARVLYRQRKNVIVSVIAPFESTRKKIKDIINPMWVYVKRDLVHAEDMPYQEPQNPDVIVDTDELSISQCVDRIWDHITSQS
ncbi:adenylyl-sulfate kinase [Candidatus Woesebacteria bacterium]|nr:adenylyl-sulfate kinase [Candidatus Woesebacteria bacterium]